MTENKKPDYTGTLEVALWEKKDKNGNITSTVQKLQSEPITQVPEGFEVIKISTNKTTGVS